MKLQSTSPAIFRYICSHQNLIGYLHWDSLVWLKEFLSGQTSELLLRVTPLNATQLPHRTLPLSFLIQGNTRYTGLKPSPARGSRLGHPRWKPQLSYRTVVLLHPTVISNPDSCVSRTFQNKPMKLQCLVVDPDLLIPWWNNGNQTLSIIISDYSCDALCDKGLVRGWACPVLYKHSSLHYRTLQSTSAAIPLTSVTHNTCALHPRETRLWTNRARCYS